MIQFPIEKMVYHHIPLIIVHPFHETGIPLIFYHGWSSSAPYQISKGAFFASYGYTVIIPESIYHGNRNALDDYYTLEDYTYFWKTIFQNIKEFSDILSLIQEKHWAKPFVMGHSMGGFTVMGIGASYDKDIKGVISFNGSGDWELSHLFLQARFGFLFNHSDPLFAEIKRRSPMEQKSILCHVPMLLTNGEDDKSVDPRAQESFFKGLPQPNKAKHITYPGQGHIVTINMLDDALHWMDEID